ncbi:MAG TPA: exosortase/archaeosortase family protein, partial [Phycisphaeraceae bacterium]
VKVSDRIWEQVAFHLQQIAAKGATFCLQCFGAVMGFDASVTGSQIHLSFLPDPLNVAEACSGLRMLMAFVALAAAMAFLWDRTWWQRATMVLMAVPIAVGVNIGRVTVLGLLCLVNPALAHGSFHIFVGMLMLIPAAGLFLLLGWVLDHILIPEEQGAAAAKSDAAHRPQTPPAQPSDQAAPLQPRLIGRSVAVGAGLTLLVGLAYALALFSIRPDLLMEAIPRWLPPVLLVVTVAALAALTVGLPRLASIRKRTGPAGLALASGLAGGVLLTAMLGQNAVIAATQAVLIKKPLPLRHELAMVPRRLGAWEQQGEDRQMSAEIVEALGSKQYIDRIYQDTSWTPTNAPGGYARLHVVYYTGTPDTVPHVPERCFVAGGLTHLGQHYPTLELAGQDYMPDAEQNGYWHPSLLEGRSRVPQLSIPVTAFTFGYPDQPDRIENVFYFFIANGKFLPTPDHVRLHGFDPRDAYSYYCKVEVQIFQVADEELAARRAADLLSAAMPEILACLPDWVDVQAGRWPLSAETAADAGR